MEPGYADLAPDTCPRKRVRRHKSLHRRAVPRVNDKKRPGHHLPVIGLQRAGHYHGNSMFGFGFNKGAVRGVMFQPERQRAWAVDGMEGKKRHFLHVSPKSPVAQGAANNISISRDRAPLARRQIRSEMTRIESRR